VLSHLKTRGKDGGLKRKNGVITEEEEEEEEGREEEVVVVEGEGTGETMENRVVVGQMVQKIKG